jgi:hypothetical protein
MAYGTAPRLVNGRWVTRKGRRLSQAGQAYWDRKKAQGVTDGQGHVNRRQTSSGIGATSSAKARPEQPTVKPLTSRQNREQRYYTKHANQPGAGGEQMQASLAPHSPWSQKLIYGLGEAIVGTPAGAVETVKHPVRVAKAIGKSYGETIHHPVRQIKKDPSTFLLNILPAYGAAGKVGIVGKVAAKEGAVAGAKALVKPSPVIPREVEHGGAQITPPKYTRTTAKPAFAEAAKPVKVARFASRNPTTRALQHQADKNLKAGLGAQSKANVSSSQAAFGRELSRQHKMRTERAFAPADALERHKLSAAENKAFEIVSDAHTPETFLKAHANAGHTEQAALTKAASRLVRNPTPRLQAAIDESRQLVARREKDMGFTEDEINRSVGKSHEEVAALAEGRRSLNQQIGDIRTQADEHGNLPPHMEKKLARLNEQLIGIGKKARANGAFYVPKRRFTELRSSPPGLYRSSQAVGPSHVPRQKELTGAAFRSGDYRLDSTRLIAQASRQASKIRLAREYWPKALSLSKETAEDAGGKYAIPVRLTRSIPPDLRRAMSTADKGELFPQDLAGLTDTQAELLQKWIYPDRGHIDPATNTVKGTSDKVRWVDRREVSGLLARARGGAVTVGGKDIDLGAMLDTVNAVPKIATLAKPGYLLNRVQQAIQNVSQQGVLYPVNSHLLRRVGEDMPAPDIYRLKAMAGAGRSRQLVPEAGRLKKAVTNTANLLGRLTDDTSRMLSLMHELRRAGLNTPEKIQKALHDEGWQVRLDGIEMRAQHEAIPFGKMSDVERRTVARALFFYPWTRAAVEWTLRFPGEHPYQASVVGNVGQQGAEATQQSLGEVPGWARSLIPVGHDRTINLANLNTAQTLSDTAEMASSLVKNPKIADQGETIEQNFGPGAAAVLGAATGTVRGRGHYSRLEAALRGGLGTLPEVSWYDRTHKGPDAAYPAQSPLEAITSSFLGGGYPRKTNVDALNRQAEQQKVATMRPGRKVLYKAGNWRKSWVDAAKGAGLLKPDATELPPELKDAIQARVVRYSRYASLGLNSHKRDPEYQRKAFEVDVKLLVERKLISPSEGRRAVAWSRTASKDDIQAARSDFTRHEFQGQTLSDYRADLKDRGFDPGDPFPPP